MGGIGALPPKMPPVGLAPPAAPPATGAPPPPPKPVGIPAAVGMAPPAGVMGTAPLSYEYKRTRFTGTQVHILTAVGRQRGHA